MTTVERSNHSDESAPRTAYSVARSFAGTAAKRAALFTLVLLGLSSALVGCRDHDGNGVDELTEAENDDRLGRRLVRCSVPQVDETVIEGILGAIEARGSTFLGAGARQIPMTSVSSRGAGSVVVPVVFHVLTDGAQGDVSDGAIVAQMAELNQGFAGGEGGTDTPFRFQLAGITRTVNPSWFGMTFGSAEEFEAKANLRQGGPETLNVYTARPGDDTLGWATFPWDFMTDPSRDGVVIDFQTVPGGALAPYNEGDTLVHETGHWMGLLHTFQGSCEAANDTIDDTPSEDRPSFGCPVGRNSCGAPGVDPIENYMDYSDDACLIRFTPQQSERIDAVNEVLRGL